MKEIDFVLLGCDLIVERRFLVLFILICCVRFGFWFVVGEISVVGCKIMLMLVMVCLILL